MQTRNVTAAKDIYIRQNFTLEKNIEDSFQMLIEAGITDGKSFNLILQNQPYALAISSTAAGIDLLRAEGILTTEYLTRIMHESPVNASVYALWLVEMNKNDILNPEMLALIDSSIFKDRDLVILKRCNLLCQENLTKIQQADQHDKEMKRRIIDCLDQLHGVGLGTQKNLDFLLTFRNINYDVYNTIDQFKKAGYLNQINFECIIRNRVRFDGDFFELLKKNGLLTQQNVSSLLLQNYTDKYLYWCLQQLNESHRLNQENLNLLTNHTASPNSVSVAIRVLIDNNLYQASLVLKLQQQTNNFWSFFDGFNKNKCLHFLLNNLDFFSEQVATISATYIKQLTFACKRLNDRAKLNLENYQILAKKPEVSFLIADLLITLGELWKDNQDKILNMTLRYLPSFCSVITSLPRSLLTQANLDKIVGHIGQIDTLYQEFGQFSDIKQTDLDSVFKKIEDQQVLTIVTAAHADKAKKASKETLENPFFRFFGSTLDRKTHQRIPNHPIGDLEPLKNICRFVRS